MDTKEIVLRVKAHWGLKVALSLALTLGFWTIYLTLQRHPLFGVTALNPSWIDDRIPFVPGTVYLYESLWLLMPIAPCLMLSRGDLHRYANSLLFMNVVGFGIFLLYPTSSPRPENLADVNVVYRTMVRVDNELNAFPSLHTAFAILSAACCHAVFGSRSGTTWALWLVWCWALGVVASTLLTKQHVFVDVMGGVVVGFGGYAVCWRSAWRGSEGKSS